MKTFHFATNATCFAKATTSHHLNIWNSARGRGSINTYCVITYEQ